MMHASSGGLRVLCAQSYILILQQSAYFKHDLHHIWHLSVLSVFKNLHPIHPIHGKGLIPSWVAVYTLKIYIHKSSDLKVQLHSKMCFAYYFTSVFELHSAE